MNTARILDFQLGREEIELERFQELIRKAADAFARSLAERVLFSENSMDLQDISKHIQVVLKQSGAYLKRTLDYRRRLLSGTITRFSA